MTKIKRRKEEKNDAYERVNALYQGREVTVNAFKSRIFPIKPTQGKWRPSELARVTKVS